MNIKKNYCLLNKKLKKDKINFYKSKKKRKIYKINLIKNFQYRRKKLKLRVLFILSSFKIQTKNLFNIKKIKNWKI